MLTFLPLSLVLSFSQNALAEVNPPDQPIQNAALADITPDGFSGIVDMLPSLVPLDFAVDNQFIEFGSPNICLGGWFDVQNLLVAGTVTDASITPQDGYLDFEVTLGISINDALNPFSLDYELTCWEHHCDVYVDPFNVTVSSRIYMNVIDMDGDGINDLDVYFDDFAFDYSDLDGNDINFENCLLGDVEDVLNYINWSLFDLVIGFIGPTLESTVMDQIPMIESLLEDTFSQLTVQQTVDLLGSPLDIALAPSDIVPKPEGLRIILDGGATTPNVAACISSFDQGGSLATPAPLMPIGSAPASISDFQIGAAISDDFVNQALYSVWRTGALCFTVDESLFPLDTTILNSLTNDSFISLFPETQPLTIKTLPVNPPVLNMGTPADLAIDVENLGLDFFAMVDGRRTRVLNVGLTTDVGVDIPFNDATGELAVSIDIDTNRIVSSVEYNEFVPDASPTIESSFSGQLDTILGLIDIESMLGNLSFALPSFSGAGLLNLEFAGTGDQDNDLGAYAGLGPVPYEGGCADTTGGGCGSTGSGCATNGRPNSRLALLGFVMLFGFLRRRSS